MPLICKFTCKNGNTDCANDRNLNVIRDENGNYTIPEVHVGEYEDGTKYNYVTDRNGNEIELPYNKTYEDGLKCNKNVGVFFAPIAAAFAESFYHPVNKEHKETFEKWGLLTERLFCWIYDTMFTDYLTPYNSFDAIAETTRFLKDAGLNEKNHFTKFADAFI